MEKEDRYFYAAFKGMWGVTPAKHRRWYREYASTASDVLVLDAEASRSALDRFLPGYHLQKMAAPMNV